MWYYELNQQPFGPVSKETLAEELKAGRITPQTRVWRVGWPQWRSLGETELSALTMSTPTLQGANVPPPVYGVNPKYKKTSPSSLTKLIWWWFSLNLFCLPYYFLFPFMYKDFPVPNIPVIVLIFLCWLPLCAGAVLHYFLIYKFWQVVQDGFARTTPGQAVGFMFIPYFNYYWFFIAYHGLARDLNAYIERHYTLLSSGQVRKAHPKMVLGYVISLCANVVFSFGMVIFLYFKMFLAVMNGGLQSNFFLAFLIPILVISGLLFIFQIIVNFDLFLSAKSILTIENLSD